MAINLHQINEHEKKKAAQQAEVKPDMTQPMAQPSSGLAQGVDKSPINNPALDESLKQSVADNVMSKPMASVGTSLSSMATAPTQGTLDSPGHNFNETADMIGKRNRINYVRGFNTWADAEKAGDVSQQEWITQKINQMVERGENPGEYETLMSLMGSAETPDEIKKRERRNALGETFRNLGNLIGNAANLYYTNKGGQYIDLNTVNEKHRARLEQVKAKQEAMREKLNTTLANAKLNDMKTARAEKAARQAAKDEMAKVALQNEYNLKRDAQKQAADAKQAEFNAKQDQLLKQIEHAFNMGEIDAKAKNDLVKLAQQAVNDKELENLRQAGRIKLKQTPSAEESKVITSLTGSDGTSYTRNTKLSDVEIRELAKYVEDWDAYTTVDEDGKKIIDYVGGIADAAESGMIPVKVLEEKGFKKGKSSSGSNTNEGFSFASQNNGFSFK